jgi:hypothetical protein
MGLHLGPPTLALSACNLQIPDERDLLFMLRMDPLQQEGDADGGTYRQEQAHCVAQKVEDRELSTFSNDLECQQQSETAYPAATQCPPELPLAEFSHLKPSADCARPTRLDVA